MRPLLAAEILLNFGFSSPVKNLQRIPTTRIPTTKDTNGKGERDRVSLATWPHGYGVCMELIKHDDKRATTTLHDKMKAHQKKAHVDRLCTNSLL